MDFTIVDVFAENRYSGNQLAVFRQAEKLTAEEMQAIAREMHFSETTFVLHEQPRGGGYDVRIFTPEREVPFAGHPTLGTAYVIRQEIIQEPVQNVTLNLGVGPIPVSFDPEDAGGATWMKQNDPEFGEVIPGEIISGVLGLDPGEVDDGFPAQEVSTGLPTIIVPLTGLEALKKATIVKDRYWELIEDTWAKLILVFSPEGYREGHDLAVRVFADYYGVPEDPATGSGNGCLAGYLVQHRYWGKDSLDIEVGQGFEINRPSLILLKAARAGQRIDVWVGGKVLKIAQGQLV